MKTELKFDSAVNVPAELLVVLAADASTSNDANAASQPVLLTKNSAFEQAVQNVLTTGEFRASAWETLLLHAPGGLQAKRLLVIGLGKQSKISLQAVRKAAGTAVRFAKSRGLRQITLALPDLASVPQDGAARAAVEGAFVGDFDPDVYRSDRKDRTMEQFTVVAAGASGNKAVEGAFREGVVLGESQNFARSLVNEPGNVLTPTVLGQRAAAMCKEQGLACEVHSTNKLKE
ncbi:MAG TPA: M17 family peptidase N-terminal domain-containing protein, partial [Acidobacteriaceae bacterium]|nr:M17 family peptidase N-terminal domain-containing protein [Acidobacteriaceae bacterium]